MKIELLRTSRAAFGVCLLAAAMAGQAFGQASGNGNGDANGALENGRNGEKAGRAVVRAIRGSARVAVNGGEWAPLKVNTVLRSGHVIQTSKESNVDLFLGVNGPVVRVTSDTILYIEKLAYKQVGQETVIDTQLNLRSGRILGNVRKLAMDSVYEIKTPAGIAGVQGTEYDISADGRVTVLSGVVIFAYIDAVNGTIQTVTLGQGETFHPTEEKRSAPQEFLTLLRRAFDEIAVIPPPADQTTRTIIVEEEPHVSGNTGSNPGNGQ
jgi:hypothetical protein